VTQAGLRQNGSLKLESYAALGDGRSVALVGADGSIDWWCPSSIDGGMLFDRILDAKDGGRFAITPTAAFTVERRYRENSNVFELVFTTATGRMRVTDSLNSGPSGRLPWSELARRVDGLEGVVECRIEVLSARKIAVQSWREVSPHGEVLHLDGLITAFRSSEAVTRIEENPRGVIASLVVRAGERSVLAVLAGWDTPLILSPMDEIDERIDRSDQAWKEWTSRLGAIGVHDAAIRRSALALKLLVYSPSGAIAAAATNGLPERMGGDKNYDYRYAWLRDVTYTIKAFLRVGAKAEAQAAFSWLMMTVRRHGGKLSTMYTLDGGEVPGETELDLPGYCDSRPVRLGNKAAAQLQLGMFGDLFETASLFVDQGHVLDLATRKLLADEADRCAEIWHSKDSGIWELEEQAHYTLSKISCWQALDRAVPLGGAGPDGRPWRGCMAARAGQHSCLDRGGMLERGKTGLYAARRHGQARCQLAAGGAFRVSEHHAAGFDMQCHRAGARTRATHLPIFRDAGRGGRFHRMRILAGGGSGVAGRAAKGSCADAGDVGGVRSKPRADA
jgi:GH15 family glucan-1,4-alpha-glucosidase